MPNYHYKLHVKTYLSEMVIYTVTVTYSELD